MKLYIAGPMTGYPKFNFEAFDDAAQRLILRGHEVISPADLDRAVGFNPETDTLDDLDLLAAIRRDVDAILGVDAVVMLPGWRKSVGATTEAQVARWARKQILEYPSLEPVDDEDVLDEAKRLTAGDRNAQYGPPDQDFTRTAGMWSAYLGHEIKSQDVALMMIMLKASRLKHQPDKRDSWTDIGGYARCGWMCITGKPMK